MLRSTPILHRGWLERFMQYPSRRYKAWWRLHASAHRKNPLNHKQPHEYGDIWDMRVGVQWYHRMKRRGAWRTWPFVDNRHDPVRNFNETPVSRSFSAKAGPAALSPLWDHYAEAGRDYRLDASCNLLWINEFLNPHVGKTWTFEQRVPLLEGLAKAGYSTPQKIIETGEEALWSAVPHIPRAFVQHVYLLCRDIARQAELKSRRVHLHEHGGVLYTEDMQRYYTIPRLSHSTPRPTWETTFPGVYPRGPYSHLDGTAKIHPAFVPDRLKKFNFRPA